MTNDFKSALRRLTLLYLIVLAGVCMVFSTALYRVASVEIDRGLRHQAVGFRDMIGRPFIDDEATEALRSTESLKSHNNLRANLVVLNLVVMGVGSGLCYYFAKRTLRPIEENFLAQQRFTGDASHELRTPLASMRTEIEVALRSKMSDEEARAVLASSLEEVVSMQTMTDNLLALARNSSEVERKSVDLRIPIRNAIAKYSTSANDRKVSVVLKLKKVSTIVNETSIEQLVGILFENAVKYGKDGGTVSVGLSREGNSVRIVVKDDGPGIADGDHEKIFERFYRSDVSRTTQVTDGHGLGLSIAKAIVDLHHGTIKVDSSPGKGAEFIVLLPLVQ